LEDCGIDGRIKLRRIFRSRGVDWIDVARDRQQAVVNVVMNLCAPEIVGTFLTS